MSPRKILLIKSHSLGVGDILRSSAAWKALREKYPGTELHLIFLSRHAGYASESLMREHFLLDGAHFVTVRDADPSHPNAKRVPLRIVKDEVQRISAAIQPDLVIDFEASGLRTTLVSRWAAQASQAKTVGISQFLGRGCLYDLQAPSTRAFMRTRGLSAPMDYTNRDFVVLAALGIERGNHAIELNLTDEGARFKIKLAARLSNELTTIGLNIGCGTADAIDRRPPLESLVEAVRLLEMSRNIQVVLTGAPFEKPINQAFVRLYRAKYGNSLSLIDIAGQTSLSALTGAIDACDAFISSDSGPYHMAVAMKKPTLAWFMREEPAAYHRVPHCICLVQPQAHEAAAGVETLLSYSATPSAPNLNKAA